MEQLDQLRTMRDQAAVRLEEARKALEKSPDAKLVSSLSSLISDLETSLGLTSTKPVEIKEKAPIKKEEPAKAPEPKKEPEPAAVEEPTPIMEKIEKAAKKVSTPAKEMSLEESLEAELLSGDDLAAGTKSN